MATMNSGLGGASGYGENSLRTLGVTTGDLDDGSRLVDITSVFGAGGLDFFGSSYTSLYINVNGTITFGAAQPAPSTAGLSGETVPTIAPFFTDINITTSGEIYWDLDTVNNKVTITWVDVPPFDGSGTNSFQVVLTDQGGGDFDIEFIYESIGFVDGSNGAGPAIATAGITDGAAQDFEIEGSGDPAFLPGYPGNDFDTGGAAGTYQSIIVGGAPVGLDGTVAGTAGDDVMGLGFIDFDGDEITTGDDTVFAGSGNDSVNGDAGNDYILGENGNDTLLGGAGNDYLDGGNDNDTLDGGIGNDTLMAGFGSDVFIGGTGNDVLDIANSTASTFGFTISLTTGVDGFGNTYAGIETILGGSGVDILTGDGEDNRLDGGDGSDTFLVLDNFGNDTILGGNGGTNFDTIDFSALTNGVSGSVAGGSGVDITVGGDTLNFSEIENVRLTDQADDIDITTLSPMTISGEAGNDTLTGADSAGVGDTLLGGADNDLIIGNDGDDSLDGEDGNDTLFGGAGADSLVGSAGNDTFYASLGTDMLFGGTGSDTLYGGGNGDTLFGGDNDDVLDGDTENDRIDGGAGNDTLLGGLGTDTFIGGTGNDVMDIANSAVSGFAFDIDLSTGVDTYGNTYSGIETILGGNGNDVFVGDGIANRLEGGTGADSIDGGDGDDTIFGGIGNDTLRTGEGNDTLYGGDGNDELSNSAGDDTLFGGTGDDTLTASAGNDSLDGGAGNDTLYGGADNDTMDGGADNDDIFGGTGDDTIDGGTGQDTIDGGGGNDEIYAGSGDDSVDGGAGADTIYGNAGNDTISGGDGNDLILGGTDGVGTGDTAGNTNTLSGDAGDDTIRGSQGNDSISGGADNDSIAGNEGDDTIDGGDGNDTLQGGIGNDELSGGSGDDTLTGGDGNDTLFGGTGNDTLTGGDGADSLTGGSDADVFIVDDGGDTITDFDATTGIGDGDTTNNDFVDLTGFYNIFTLSDWNAANPGQTYGTALDWLRADQADGTLNEAGNLSINNGGSAVAASSLNAENTGVVCFTSGTAIHTPQGDVLIDDLCVGDLVTTMDNGPQPIRWIGTTSFDAQQLAAHPNIRPILIERGVLGVARDMFVSPQHGLLIDETHLARATHLAQTTKGVRIAKGRKSVTYIHIMFDAHQIIFAENAPSESFYPGPMALTMMGRSARAAVFDMLPDLRYAQGTDPTAAFYGPTAREFIHKRDIRKVLNTPSKRAGCGISPDAWARAPIPYGCINALQQAPIIGNQTAA